MKSLLISIILTTCLLTACNSGESSTLSSAIDSTNHAPENAVDKKLPVPDKVVVADTVVAEKVCPCSARAYLVDPDTSGANIRETPNGKIIGKLKYENDYRIVWFKSAQGPWLELSTGGWVFAPLFEVNTATYMATQQLYFYESSSKKSKKVADYTGSEIYVKVLSCNEKWLYVQHKDGTKGWLSPEVICGNPLTTCP